MNCKKCGSSITAETIDAGSYDCCILTCSGCGTLIDKSWKKKSNQEVE